MTNDSKQISALREEDSSSAFMARQIVQEVLDFGVNQEQIIKIIYILSLEIENRELMISVSQLIDDFLTGNSTGQKNSDPDLVREV
jgi:hypothetical protein